MNDRRRPRLVLAGPLYHSAGEELLKPHCDVHLLPNPSTSELSNACSEADALIARYPHVVDHRVYANSPTLLLVSASGRGSDAIDVEAATRHGVAVINNPGHGTRPVSELAIALMLGLARNVVRCDAAVRTGNGWEFRSDAANFVELAGKTLGIVGFGSIGRETARKAIVAFGMQVLAYDPYVSSAAMEEIGASKTKELSEVLKASDFVSLHPEMNAETLWMIDEAELRQMKRSAFLINTSRGKTLKEAALVRALSENWIRGAALDVYQHEPVPEDSPLLGLPNVLLSPHIGSLTPETAESMAVATAKEVLKAFSGERPNGLLNPDVWPLALQRCGIKLAS